MAWATLPKEMLSMIFSDLTCNDLTSAVCVNSTWNSLADSDHIWKEAIFNDSVPHHHSASEKGAPWRQFVQKHLSTKRNIIKKSCVQFTLGTRSPTKKPSSDIVLRNKTASGKYCLLVWEVLESPWNSYTTHFHISTELWDMEKRKIIHKYDLQQSTNVMDLALCNGYILKDLERGAKETFYAKLDPEQDKLEFNGIALNNMYNMWITIKQNDDKNSSLVAFAYNDLSGEVILIRVYDLRTGMKIHENDWTYDQYPVFEQFIGDKIVVRFATAGFYLILDVLQNKEIVIEENNIALSCAALAGDELWIASTPDKCLVKYNIYTMKRQKYNIKEDISNAFKMQIFDGIIWLHCRGTNLVLIEAASPDCRVLTRISLPGRDEPNIAQMPNGAISCLSTSYAYILSFRDEDISLPIQVLQIETNGQNKGDLNAMILKHSPHLYSVTSQIVHQDGNERYCIIFMHTQEKHKGKPVNDFAEKAKKWMEKVYYHKTGIFQLVLFDLADKSPSRAPPMKPIARGPCWVFYETKLSSGGWQRSIPVDYWKFFKTKLGLK